MPSEAGGASGLPGVDFESWLLKFDKRGACASPKTRDALLARLQAVPQTPVILFSHGWNNEFGDATALYAAFLRHLQAHFEAGAPGPRRPLFVGVVWPSTWLSWDQGPRIAAAASGDAADGAERALQQELAEALPDEVARERLHRLFGLPRLTREQGAELARLVSSALGAMLTQEGGDGAEAAAPDPGTVLSGLEALQGLAPAASDGGGDELGGGGTIDGGSRRPPQHAGALAFLDPRGALRLASVYQMKDRAGTVGWHGVSRLIDDILATSKAPLHTVGHSYGAKVVLSAIAAATAARQVETVLLLQPAVSHLGFAAEVPGREGGGGYRTVPAKVKRAILATYSAHDFPLHTVFHRALRREDDLGELRIAGGATTAGHPPSPYAALGGYGPRGAGERLVDPMPDPGARIDMPGGPLVVGIDGTGGRRVGGHGDVATPHTAWLLYLQMTA